LNEVPIINDNSKVQNSGLNSIPTLDEDVRAQLRKLEEPVTYFGESASDRRERLIKLISERPHQNFTFDHEIVTNESGLGDLQDEAMSESDDEEDFYTPGDESLYEARRKILSYSLSKAGERVNKLRANSKNQDFIKMLKHRRNINLTLSKIDIMGTQVIPQNSRTISAVRFSKNSSLIACGSWDGNIYILDSNSLSTKHILSPNHHKEKASALDWDLFTDSGLLVSGGNEGNINFWKPEETMGTKMSPVQSIKSGHNQRITKTLFHPHGSFIASTSFDQTWKLWDITTQQCLMTQEGHSREVFAGSFHRDGSLFTSGGLDGVTRVWDLRSGRAIATLQKHSKGVYSCDWSPNGVHLATASGDCSVKIWDMRKLYNRGDEIFTIPAHTKIVSEVRFFHRRDRDGLSTSVDDQYGSNPETLDSNGTFLVTSSYDGLVNIWSSDNWVKVKSLKGHNDKVLCCDINGSGSAIVSGGWDRSVKLWKTESETYN
jgi:U4/U6 small nuclear ribonucleoprotein PRP4